MLTLKEIADAILALTPAQQAESAEVWPPVQCPAAQGVPITGIGKKLDGKPVILTGKPVK